ncbi:ABC transporter permease [Pseudaestuariivita rosea]|uniref:ABC transporter permease n=1 Tax=Pseudaestuariivita rosea TaxID=2763263 RepID=UPI002350CDF0|nr:ABC transporter permease [Pseudaestuariivita rosea]
MISVGVSGLLMIMQLSLMFGAFRNASAPITMSDVSFWVGPAGSTSLESSSGLTEAQSSLLWLIPEIERMEAYAPVIGDLRLPKEPGDDTLEQEHWIQIIGTPSTPDGMLYSELLPLKTRAALAEPGSIILDTAFAARLDVEIGDRVLINSKDARIIGLVDGLRGVLDTPVITSQVTARFFAGTEQTPPKFILVKLRDDVTPEALDRLLSSFIGHPDLTFWMEDELIASSMASWMASGLGAVFTSSVGIALVVTLLIVSQSFAGSVAASIREYAALRAYGLSFGRLQRLVMAQGGIVGIAAIGVTAIVAGFLISFLRARNVSVVLTPSLVIWSAVALMIVVFLSNLLALRRLRRADPAALLR